MPSSLQSATDDIHLTIDLFIARGMALFDTFNLRAYPVVNISGHQSLEGSALISLVGDGRTLPLDNYLLRSSANVANQDGAQFKPYQEVY